MKFHGVFPLLLALVPTGAAASDLSLGLGLGVLHDLTPRKGDARLDDEALPVASCDDTFGTDGTYNCGPNSPLSLLGGRIAVPIRYALTDRTVLRFGPRVEYGGRSGRVIFQCTDDIDVCNERSTDFPDFTLTNGDDVMGTKHWAYSVTAMAAVGTEISIPVGESNIYFGGEIAGGMVFTMESLGPDESGDKSPTDGVLDKYRHPKDGVEGQCGDPSKINADGLQTSSCQDAFVFQPAVGVDVMVGWRGAGKTPLFVELGYGAMRVSEASLNPYPDYDLRHGAYLWNPVRLTAGIIIDL